MTWQALQAIDLTTGSVCIQGSQAVRPRFPPVTPHQKPSDLQLCKPFAFVRGDGGRRKPGN